MFAHIFADLSLNQNAIRVWCTSTIM